MLQTSYTDPAARALPRDRDADVVRTFAALRDGESLTLIYDHEPRSLMQQLEESFPESFAWSQRNLGRGWEVTLRRIDAVPSPDPLARFLERCPFLGSATETTKKTFARVATTRLIAKNKPVALQGVSWPFLGVVRTGRIFAVVSSPEGREQILHDAPPFDVFGETMLFDRGDSIARFCALSEASEVVLLPAEDVAKAMLSDDGLRTTLAAICGRRTRALVDLLCAQVSKPVVARIAMLLGRYAGDHAATVPVGGDGSALTLSQIAAAAGTVKEVVARALSRLEGEGAIRRNRGKIFIVDAAKLARFV